MTTKNGLSRACALFAVTAALGCSAQDPSAAAAAGAPDERGAQEACTHSICNLGKPLMDGCNTCVTDVCSIDMACCTKSWDQHCIDIAHSVCNAVCPGPCTSQADCNRYGSKCCATDSTATAGYCELPGVGCPNDLHYPPP